MSSVLTADMLFQTDTSGFSQSQGEKYIVVSQVRLEAKTPTRASATGALRAVTCLLDGIYAQGILPMEDSSDGPIDRNVTYDGLIL